MNSSAADRWERLVEDMLSSGSVTYGNGPGGSGRAFGSNALKTSGRIFALFSHDRLVLKLPARRVDELIQAGVGRRFDPGHGRLQREWLDVGVDDFETWQSLATEARAFVAERPR